MRREGGLGALPGLVAICGLASSAAVHAAPAPSTAPQLAWTYEIWSSGFTFAGDEQPSPAAIVRDVWRVRNDFDALTEAAVPEELKMGPGAWSTYVMVEFAVTADDRITDCKAISIEQFLSKGAMKRLDSPGISEAVCRLVAAHSAFRHGLLRDGKPFGRRLQMRISFSRWNAEDRLLQPVAPPPLPQVPWPPEYLPGRTIPLTALRWDAFLPPRKNLPKPVSTGALIAFDPQGAVISCKIMQTSGNPDFDSGVCATLKAAKADVPMNSGNYNTYNYPVLVRWDGKSASVAPFGEPAEAMLAGNGALPVRLAPPGELPRNAVVGLSLEYDKTGKVVGCRIVASAMHDALDLFSCTALPAKLKFKPRRDIFGVDNGGSLSFEVDWRARTIHRQNYY